MVFLNALGGVFGLMLIVGVGYFLGRLGWFNAESRKLLPKVVTNVTLPPLLACTALRHMERGQLLDMFWGAAAPLLVMTLLFVLAYVVGKLARVEKRHFGLFCACVSIIWE